MFLRRVVRFAASQQTPTRIPKAPKLLSGELENFRFDAENTHLFDGYTLDELYGSKIGLKHSPAVQAEMRKYHCLTQRHIRLPAAVLCGLRSDLPHAQPVIAKHR